MWNKTYSNRLLLILLLSVINAPESRSQLNRLKLPKSRVGSSKFSLNPLKPLMKFVRDPLKASAQRHYPKYLPPPPGMFQSMSPQTMPPRASIAMASAPWQRYYSPPPTKMLPPSTISLMPPLTALPSSMVFSTLPSNSYKTSFPALSALSTLPSDIQIKTLRMPSRYRKPSGSHANLNLADSVVRQLLDYPNQDSMPSVLVIEDPDVSAMSSSSNNNADLYQEPITPTKAPPTILVAPPMNGGDLSDSSSDISMSNTAHNPDVFVIVSKNSKNRGLFMDDKKSDLISSSSSTPKLKKYKITSSLDDFGNGGTRQVWIIKR